MSKELWALGRAVQALQADDDATSGVSRPWGPDATGPGNTTTPGGRQSRGHPMLPDRGSPTSWAMHSTTDGPAVRSQPRDVGPPYGCGRHFRHPWTEAAGSRGHPLDLIHGSLKGARRCPSVPTPRVAGRLADLFSDPVAGSSVRVVCPHAGECPTTIRPRRWRRRRAGPSRATSASARTPFRGA
jgi:hypothetical protein